MPEWYAVLVGFGALVLGAAGGWPLTTAVLALAARAHDADQAEPAEDGTPEAQPAAGIPRAPGGDPGTHGDDVPDGDLAPRPGGAAADPVHAPPRAVLRGGTWIGLLERLAVTGCLVAGYPAGIAYVVAIKGLGRYPELREHPGLSERFVIGTLASMGWAALVGASARTLLT